jgi:hypothetical protein
MIDIRIIDTLLPYLWFTFVKIGTVMAINVKSLLNATLCLVVHLPQQFTSFLVLGPIWGLHHILTSGQQVFPQCRASCLRTVAEHVMQHKWAVLSIKAGRFPMRSTMTALITTAKQPSCPLPDFRAHHDHLNSLNTTAGRFAHVLFGHLVIAGDQLLMGSCCESRYVLLDLACLDAGLWPVRN